MTIQILNLLDITIEVSVLILIITIIRLKLKKYLTPNAVYFLWIFVLLCILVPFRIGIKIVPKADVQNVIVNLPPDVVDHIPLVEVTERPDRNMPEISAGESIPPSAEQKEDMGSLPDRAEENPPASSIPLPYLIWGLTAAGMAIYVIISNIRFYFYAGHNREEVGICEDHIKIYSLKGYNCLAGIFAPAIYIDEESLKEDVLIDNIIRHEYQHYKVKDNVWQLLRITCLILQWHNPLMWWAYYASKRDCELACDMRVIRHMTKEERYLYGDSLLTVLKQKNKWIDAALAATSMGESGKHLKDRIRLIMKFKDEKILFPAVMISCLMGLVSLFTLNIILEGNQQTADGDMRNDTISSEDISANEIPADEGTDDTADRLQIDINISDYYLTDIDYINNMDYPDILYHIDEEGVLWGCGHNFYGQLGQGPQGADYYEEMVKIAENVIHVDYSTYGFAVFLTEDHKLYGMGNADSGALLEDIDIFEDMALSNNEYLVYTPKLLIENVVYARCGIYDVACLLEDGSVWNLGSGMYGGVASEPIKKLDDAVFLTGGGNHHAALLSDGSVWTWGYNFVGNCGVNIWEKIYLGYPEKVAEDVVMVWTGTTECDIKYADIPYAEQDHKRELPTTIILKNDGTYWACGGGLGEETLLHETGVGVVERDDIYVKCTSEFVQVMSENDLRPVNMEDSAIYAEENEL